MRVTGDIDLIGSGPMGFGRSHPLDCHVYLVHDGDEAIIDVGPILARLDGTGVPRAIGRLLLTHICAADIWATSASRSFQSQSRVFNMLQ